MLPRLRTLASLSGFALTLSSACAPGVSAPFGDPVAAGSRIVSVSTLGACGPADLLHTLERCHPRFLRPWPECPHPPVAYLDGTRLTDLSALGGVPTASVVEVRYLPGSEATTRFGTGHIGGAVVVRTR